MSDTGKKPADDKSDDAKEELAENAAKHGGGKKDDAVEDYVEGEETYSRDPDSVKKRDDKKP